VGAGTPRTTSVIVTRKPGGTRCPRRAAVVCPGPDAIIQTTPDPADELSVTSLLCDLCPGSLACIIPGDDGILQTIPDALDVLTPFISTGADGSRFFHF
jgi:hypothetical protein